MTAAALGEGRRFDWQPFESPHAAGEVEQGVQTLVAQPHRRHGQATQRVAASRPSRRRPPLCFFHGCLQPGLHIPQPAKEVRWHVAGVAARLLV